MENLKDYLTRWVRNSLEHINDEIKKQADIHGIDLKEVGRNGTELHILRQDGKETDNFSGTYSFLKNGKYYPFMRLEFYANHYRIFTMPKRNRQQRRANEKNQGKIISLTERGRIKQASSMEEAHIEARTQEILDNEKKTPSTTTDPLKP